MVHHTASVPRQGNSRDFRGPQMLRIFWHVDVPAQYPRDAMITMMIYMPFSMNTLPERPRTHCCSSASQRRRNRGIDPPPPPEQAEPCQTRYGGGAPRYAASCGRRPRQATAHKPRFGTHHRPFSYVRHASTSLRRWWPRSRGHFAGRAADLGANVVLARSRSPRSGGRPAAVQTRSRGA